MAALEATVQHLLADFVVNSLSSVLGLGRHLSKERDVHRGQLQQFDVLKLAVLWRDEQLA